MRSIVILIVAIEMLNAVPARASCADPRGCFTELCQFHGNIAEVTVVDGETPAYARIRVRVDALRLVDAERFAAPEVGSEVEITPVGASAGRAYQPGERFVGLTRESGNVAWPLFLLTEKGDVGCVAGGPNILITLEELETIVRSGRCDQGAPLPEPPGECNDTDGCAATGSAWGWVGVIGLLRWRNRRSRRLHAGARKRCGTAGDTQGLSG